MTNIFSLISNYIIIFLMGIYTFSCFSVFGKDNERVEKRILARQSSLMFIIHFIAFAVMFIHTNDMNFVFMYVAQLILFMAIIGLYKILYPKASRLLVNNMCMLICIGYIMLARIQFDEAINQFIFGVLGAAFGLFVPVIIRKFKFLAGWRWIYAGIGIFALIFVLTNAPEVGGATRRIAFAGIYVQPSEIVKILFVFFAAASFRYSTEFKNVVITTALAAAHVIILVLSVDLGTAVTLFVAYVTMLYVATRQPLYVLLGGVAGTGAAYVGHRLFSHVQTRVAAWRDPFAIFGEGGFQLAQSFFAIGTGSWFGLGLFRGRPDFIPEVTRDFVFSGIAEELGIIFALCLIMICISCYVMFLNVAMELRQPFYKMVALGLGTIYIFQVFLTIGGGIGLIPSTGVTLPLVSYGGSSFLTSMVMFGIIQGLYIVREDEEDIIELFEQRKRDDYEEVERAPKGKRREEPTFQEVPKQRVR